MKRKCWVLFLSLSLWATGYVCTASAAPLSLPANLDPSSAMTELKEGNQRFIEGSAISCEGITSARTRNANSQAPNAIVLSCSDSRVPPEQVFDQELGQLFVVRVAGNILNKDAIASIEYAVLNLGARLIVIMGHESCGAVKAAIDTPATSDTGSENLNHLLAEIRENLGNTRSPADPTLRLPVMKNVSAVAGELVQRSTVIANGIVSGQVQIEQAIYDLSSGAVDFWESFLGDESIKS